MKVTIGTRCYSNNPESSSSVAFEVNGTKEEIMDFIASFSTGTKWTRIGDNSELIALNAFKEPVVTKDPKIDGHFKEGGIIRLDKNLKEDNENCEFFVQSIAGYDGNYAEKSKKLEEVGFSCLRSKREKDGKFWEIWYLPSKYSAKGELEAKSKEDIFRFLCNLPVGQIIISGEHWGMTID